MFEDKPRETSDALDYFIAAQNGQARAWCGQCGDYGYGYTLKYLQLVGCELPKEYQDYNEAPAEFSVVATQRVATLPDVPLICKEISHKFTAGNRGIIKYAHATGEIWGIPEKHGNDWLVTICYPEER